MSHRARVLALVAALVVGPTQAAGMQWCAGKVVHVLTYADGSVHLFGEWRADYTQVCSLAGDWKGVSAVTCKAWVSTAQVALVSGRNVIVQYADLPACNAIPAYGAAPGPAYLMLRSD
jgi:hypothetical protein